MKKLKFLFEELGFNNVTTYINSGNVIFEADDRNLIDKVSPAINQEFNLDTVTLILSKGQLKNIVGKIKKSWFSRTDWRHNVMFLWPEVDSRVILKEIENKDGVDEVVYAKGALLWATNKDELSRSGGQKLVGTKLYKNMTVRNLNTTLKIWELMQN